jgi:DNA-binding GntR family transcriptional regulator
MNRIGSTIAESVAERLRSEIHAGSILPGEFLRQNAVAERLGVSSTPVREAFAILEREGMVRREPHRGVVVFKPTIQDLLDGYEIREVLEVLAARRAAKRLTKEDLEWLDDLSERMPTATDRAEYLKMNQAFHERIEQAGGSRRLCELISAQRAAASTYVSFLGLEPASAKDTVEEHHAIVVALASRRPEAAAKAMSIHIRARAVALRARLTQAADGADVY